MHQHAGDSSSHSLLQVSANPISSFFCALIAAKHSFTHVGHVPVPSDSSPDMQRSSSDSSTGSDTLPTQLQDNTAASSLLDVGGSSASQQRPGLHASGTEHGIGTVSTETSLIGQPQREAAHASASHQVQGYSHGNGAVNRGNGSLTGGNGAASGGSGAAVGGRGTPNGDRPRRVPLQSQQAATAGSGWRCHGLQGPWSNPIKANRLQGSAGNQAADTTASSRSSELDLGVAGKYSQPCFQQPTTSMLRSCCNLHYGLPCMRAVCNSHSAETSIPGAMAGNAQACTVPPRQHKAVVSRGVQITVA